MRETKIVYRYIDEQVMEIDSWAYRKRECVKRQRRMDFPVIWDVKVREKRVLMIVG